MKERTWVSDYRKTLVCIDSYANGIPKGRFYNPYQEAQTFESLTQFLVKMEELLDEGQIPQSYTARRSFSPLVLPLEDRSPSSYHQKGVEATFEVQILFRQHTSWQGVVIWLDQNMEQSFRSVLELVLLMDSALRKIEGKSSYSA